MTTISEQYQIFLNQSIYIENETNKIKKFIKILSNPPGFETYISSLVNDINELNNLYNGILTKQLPVVEVQKNTGVDSLTINYNNRVIQNQDDSIRQYLQSADKTIKEIKSKIDGSGRYHLTADKTKTYFDLLRGTYDIDYLDEVEREYQEQRTEELNFLSQYTACSIENRVHNRLTDLNPKRVKQIIDKYFYSNEVMESVACIFSSIIANNLIPTSQLVKSYIQYLKHLTFKSVSGDVMFGSLKEKDVNLFAIKSSKEPDDDFLHEAFIGLFGTNTLRKSIPNFSYVYGFFKCSLPAYTSDNNVLTWCNTNTAETDFVLYENITNSESFSNFDNGLSSFFEVFLQTLYALKIAYQEIDFTHYDLHSENLLVKKLDKKYAIKYDDIYIETEYIAMIIDYGFSHIKFNNKHYGLKDTGLFSRLDVRHDQGKIVYDVHKLLLHKLAKVRQTNRILYDKIKDLARYFYDDQYVGQVLDKINTYFYAPPRLQFNILDFIVFCQNYAKNLGVNVVTTNPTHQLLKCDDNICSDLTNVLKFEGIDLSQNAAVPNTFLEFYDLYSYIQDQSCRASFSKIFYTYGLINNATAEANVTFEEYLKSPVINLNVPKTYNNIMDILINFSKLINIYQKCSLLNTVILYIDGLYNEHPLQNLIDFSNKVMTQKQPEIDNCFKFVKELYRDIFTKGTLRFSRSDRDTIGNFINALYPN